MDTGICYKNKKSLILQGLQRLIIPKVHLGIIVPYLPIYPVDYVKIEL